MTTPVFLYDGDCGFCTRGANFLERRMKTEVGVEPWQRADLEALGIERQVVEGAVQWVEPGLVKAGPDAIAVLLRRAQWYWKPLGWIASLKPVSWLLWPIYRLIARNRHRMPGGTAVCILPQSERGSESSEAQARF